MSGLFDHFGALDPRAVTAVLVETASRDPDELDSVRARFGRWTRVPRLAGGSVVLLGLGAALYLGNPWIVPGPVAIGWWFRHRAAANRRALEAAIRIFATAGNHSA